MWGQDEKLTELSDWSGIIPTRVGTREGMSEYAMLKEDHPHACGDKFISIGVFCALIGSSPRVWGQDRIKVNVMKCDGIIPTRVGTSATSFITSEYNEDHPHACGDKGKLWQMLETITGSSPRVWGQVIFWHYFLHFTRIIPTRVGTS